VLLLNDDYTPMDFVVGVLQQGFAMTREQATHVMLQVHRSGMGTCGVFTKEVADTKVAQVVDLASQHQHPLQCTMEPEYFAGQLARKGDTKPAICKAIPHKLLWCSRGYEPANRRQ